MAYRIRISDRKGSHWSQQTFDDLALACARAVRMSGHRGSDEGAEVAEIVDGKAFRVAEFFEGRPIKDCPRVEVPIY